MKNYFYVLMVLIVFIFSCEKLPSPSKAFDLSVDKLIDLDVIPLEYGKLISVTSAAPGIAHLWFEDENKTIRMVGVNYGEGVVSKDVRIINRDYINKGEE